MRADAAPGQGAPHTAAFRLRIADMRDAAAVSALYQRSFTATFGHLYPPEELADFLAARGPAQFAQDLGCVSNRAFLAESPSGDLLGFCLMGEEDLGLVSLGLTPERPWWVLKKLYMDEAGKGLGAAQALMEAGIDEAKARGAELLYLTVWIDNHRARRFYEKRGFVEIGKFAYQVGSTVDDDRIMKLVL